MTDLDELMDKDPLSLTKSDIDDIIAYHRRLRAEPGQRPKRETAPGPKIDLAAIGLAKPAPPPIVRRRL